MLYLHFDTAVCMFYLMDYVIVDYFVRVDL